MVHWTVSPPARFFALALRGSRGSARLSVCRGGGGGGRAVFVAFCLPQTLPCLGEPFLKCEKKGAATQNLAYPELNVCSILPRIEREVARLAEVTHAT